MKTCEICAEDVHDDAQRCKHCGTVFEGTELAEREERRRTWTRRGIQAVVLLAIFYAALWGFAYVAENWR